MINRTLKVPVKRQAELMGISRGTAYYRPEPIRDADMRLMRRINALHLELPFAGSRMLRDLLNAEGFEVGRRHLATLMRTMGRSTASPTRARSTPSTRCCRTYCVA